MARAPGLKVRATGTVRVRCVRTPDGQACRRTTTWRGSTCSVVATGLAAARAGTAAPCFRWRFLRLCEMHNFNEHGRYPHRCERSASTSDGDVAETAQALPGRQGCSASDAGRWHLHTEVVPGSHGLTMVPSQATCRHQIRCGVSRRRTLSSC